MGTFSKGEVADVSNPQELIKASKCRTAICYLQPTDLNILTQPGYTELKYKYVKPVEDSTDTAQQPSTRKRAAAGQQGRKKNPPSTSPTTAGGS